MGVQSYAIVTGALSALAPYWRSLYTGLQCSVTGPYHMPQFYDLCSSPNIIKVMRWAGQVAHTWKKRNLYTAFMRKPEGRSLLGKPYCRLVSSGSGYRKVVSSCEHGDKTLGCTKMWWTLQPGAQQRQSGAQQCQSGAQQRQSGAQQCQSGAQQCQ